MLNPVVTVANLVAVLLASLALEPVVLDSAGLGALEEVDWLLPPIGLCLVEDIVEGVALRQMRTRTSAKTVYKNGNTNYENGK